MGDNDIVGRLEEALSPKKRKCNVRILPSCYIYEDGRVSIGVQVEGQKSRAFMTLGELMDLIDDMMNCIRHRLTGKARGEK